MEETKKKGKIVPNFKNLGFIVPKKKSSKKANRPGDDDSSTEDSPRIADDNSNSSTASNASLSNVSDNSCNDKIKEDPTPTTSTDAKSATGIKTNEKVDFKKPFSEIFNKISKKPIELTTTSDSGKMAPKSTAKKPSETAEKPPGTKVVGTSRSDERYEDLFDSIIKRYSQEDSPAETVTTLDDAIPAVSSTNSNEVEKESSEQLTKTNSDIIPHNVSGAAGSEKSKNENILNKKDAQKKGEMNPLLKSLGFIVPKKKKKSKNAVKRDGDGSATEDSPRIADYSSDSSIASTASLSDVSDSSCTDKRGEKPTTSTDAKSVPGIKMTKLDFKKPFSGLFKKISYKPTTTSDSGEMAPKSTAKKPSEKKVVGTPLSDKRYEDLFNSVITRYSQPAETDPSFNNNSVPVSTTESTEFEQESNEQLSKTDQDIIPNSIDGAAGSEKSKNENPVEKKQPAFAKPTAVPKKSPGFKKVSSSNVAGKSEGSTNAKELSVPDKYPLVPTTSVDASVSNSSSSDAKKDMKTGENRNDVNKTLISKQSSKSFDEKKISEPSEKNITKPKMSNKPSSITKKQGNPKVGSKLPSTSSSKENQLRRASSFEPESSKVDMRNKSSSSAISKKQGTPKGSSKSVESVEPSTSSSLHLNQTPGASTANDSSTIDVYDFVEDEGADTRSLNTQNTIWGRDRGIVYDPLPRSKNYKEQMLYLRKSRNIGLWVQCCNKDCGKYRYCQDLKDPLEVPKIWTCAMNKDLEFNSCLIPQQRQPWSVENEVDVLENKYTAGSVVWAMLPGYPWWPAIVDDDPDVEMFWWCNDSPSSKPISYHVVFFDQKVSRAWVTEGSIQPFYPNKNMTPKYLRNNNALADRLSAARAEATSALSMSIPERLEQFGFISRFKGPIRKNTLEIDESSEDDNSEKRIQRTHPSASRLHSPIHGQRETRKRQLISKKIRSLKRQKMVRQYLAKKPYGPPASINLESDSTEEEEEEEEEQGGENENEPMQINEKEEHEIRDNVTDGIGEPDNDAEEKNVEEDENEGSALIEDSDEDEKSIIADKGNVNEKEEHGIGDKEGKGNDGIEEPDDDDDDDEEKNVEDENEGTALIEDSDEDEKSIIAEKGNVNEKEEHGIRDKEGKGNDGIEEPDDDDDDDEEKNVEDENEGTALIEDSDEDEKSIIADKGNVDEKEEHGIRDKEGKGNDGTEEPDDDDDDEEKNVEDENEGTTLFEDSDEDEKSIIADKGNVNEKEEHGIRDKEGKGNDGIDDDGEKNVEEDENEGSALIEDSDEDENNNIFEE